MKKLFIGLGNPIVGDDGIGIKIVEELTPGVASGVKTLTGAFPAFTLMEEMIGFEEVYIVDAVFGQPPGEIIESPLSELSGVALMESVHRTNLYGAIQAGKRLGLTLPEKIQVLGIKIKPVFEFSEAFSPEISRAFPRILEKIRQKI